MSSRTWWAAGLLLVVLSLGLRVAYVEATPRAQRIHDAYDYDGHARAIAATGSFSPTLAHRRPSAFRPPGYPYVLGAVFRLTGVRNASDDTRAHVAQLLGALIGALTVGMIGLLAAQLWGRLAALVAAALAAVYVPLVTVGTAMMSEGLSTLVSLAALVAALQHRRSAHRWRWALLAGVLCGLAVLTRPNAAVLLLPLGLAVWGRPRLSLAALGPPVALVAAAVLAVAPWTIRNAVVLDAFVPVTTQLGSAMAGTYNDVSRRDGDNPWSWRSIDHVPAYEDLAARVSKIPEAELERRVRARAIEYIRERPVSVAEVGFWNTIRMLELAGFKRAQETAATISIPPGPAIAGVLCFWLHALLAVAGAFTARARSTPLHVWLVPLLFAASVVFLTLETPRYRTPVEPFVVLLAALAVTALVERRTGRGATARAPA